MELFAVILLAGGAFLAGWFISLRRAGAKEAPGERAALLPPLAQVYEEGYRQGFLDAQAAMEPAGVRAASAGDAPAPPVTTRQGPSPQAATAQPGPTFSPPSHNMPREPLARQQPGVHQEQHL